MGKDSGIAWCDNSNSPWQGCRKRSEGCEKCYMYRDKKRWGQDPRRIHRSTNRTFNRPLHWPEPSRIFVCPWSDFFLKEADPWREEYYEIIRKCPQHTFLLLTKREDNIVGRLPEDWGEGYPNVWLGITGENQKRFEQRMAILKDIPAIVRFVSAEPLLSALDIRGYEEYIDWLIVAGESGPGARPFDMRWAYDLRDQCSEYGVAFFMKQMGANAVLDGVPHPFKHRSGEDTAEWPSDLQIRQSPGETSR